MREQPSIFLQRQTHFLKLSISRSTSLLCLSKPNVFYAVYVANLLLILLTLCAEECRWLLDVKKGEYWTSGVNRHEIMSKDVISFFSTMLLFSYYHNAFSTASFIYFYSIILFSYFVRSTLQYLILTEGYRGLSKGFSLNILKGPITMSLSLTTYDLLIIQINNNKSVSVGNVYTL